MSDTGTSTNPFVEDPTKDPTSIDKNTGTDSDLEQGNTTPAIAATAATNPFEEVALEDFDSNNSEPDPVTSTNPFDDPVPVVAKKNESPINPFDDPAKDIATPHPDTEHRDRFYECDADDDSVRSMLEMMETKNDPSQQNKPARSNSLRKKKPRRSLNRWRWMSPPQNHHQEDVEEEESLESYDCIALSSLKKKLTSGWGDSKNDIDIEEDNDDDDDDVDVGDEESQHSKPTSLSDGTTTTKNTGNGSDSHGAEGATNSLVAQNFKSHLRLKYVFPLACFLAIVLLLGILILSYSLYALRQEDGGEGLTIFTSEFWRKEVPKTLAFWKEDAEDASGSGP